MELQTTSLDQLRLVSDAIVGAVNPEVRGGAVDGAAAPMLVIAQLELVSARRGGPDGPEVVHLGFTREAALDVARQLQASAALLKD